MIALVPLVSLKQNALASKEDLKCVPCLSRAPSDHQHRGGSGRAAISSRNAMEWDHASSISR